MPDAPILIAQRRNTRAVQLGDVSGHVAGRALDPAPVIAAIGSRSPADELARICHSWHGPFAVMLRGPDWAFAAVDKVRRLPLFYANGPGGAVIGDDAMAVRSRAALASADWNAMLEFRLSGYVSGRRTLIENLEQLLAGEFLLWRPDAVTRQRYYVFPGAPSLECEPTGSLIERADATFDAAFTRTIADAAGRPIWVALSAGLDSRLVLAKLKALKYDNVTAFTYGTPGNFESKGAKYVADKVGVPWVWLPDTMAEGRVLARSGILPPVWEYGSGLSSTPMVVDMPCFAKTVAGTHIPTDAVIVNGQSGDYSTGGHLTAALAKSTSRAEMLDAIKSKHFDLLGPAVRERYRAVIDRSIEESIGLAVAPTTASGQPPIWQAVTAWEWQERQSKFVVNGQRTYEFFGYDWSLPLWDDEVTEFWAHIGPSRMVKQSLFKTYLESIDLFGVFRDFPITVWRWPGPALAVVPLARAAGFMFGSAAKDSVYRHAQYFGHTRYLWAQYGIASFLRHSRTIRNFHALNARYVMQHLLTRCGCSAAFEAFESDLQRSTTATPVAGKAAASEPTNT